MPVVVLQDPVRSRCDACAVQATHTAAEGAYVAEGNIYASVVGTILETPIGDKVYTANDSSCVHTACALCLSLQQLNNNGISWLQTSVAVLRSGSKPVTPAVGDTVLCKVRGGLSGPSLRCSPLAADRQIFFHRCRRQTQGLLTCK